MLKIIPQSDNLFKDLANIMPDLVWVCDLNKKCFYFNNSWLEFTGCNFEDEIGDGWTRGIHSEDLPDCLNTFTKAFNRREAFQIEYRLCHQDGSYHWLLNKGVPRYDESRNFLGYISSCSDITELKNAQNSQIFLSKASEILASSLNYQSTLKHIARLAVPKMADWCTVDIVKGDGSIKSLAVEHVDKNKIALALKLESLYAPQLSGPEAISTVIKTGRSILIEEISEEMLDRSIHNLDHRALLKKLGLKSSMVVPLKTNQKVFGTITFANAENSHKYNHEDLRLAEELAVYAALAIENARLYTAAKKQIAEQAKMERSLKISEEKFRYIADSDMIGIAFFNILGIITEANDEFLSIIGYNRKEFTDSNLALTSITPAEWHKVDEQALEELRQTGSIKPFEKEYLRKDGTLVPVLIGGALFADSQKEGVAFILDITERKNNEKALLHQALHDSLTGLPNRSLLQDRLSQAITQAAISHKQCAVLFLDLDHFKNLNDTLGHQAGDQLLTELTNRLSNATTANDTVARFGGDEFVIIVNNIEKKSEITDQIKVIFNLLQNPFLIENKKIFINTSIGVAVYPDHGKEKNLLLKHADIALYQAKKNGRNCYVFFQDGISGENEKRLDLETEMRSALEHGEFRLYYQPIINSINGTITGSEALIRWQHPERGLLCPNSFIPYAEESGLIYPLSKWVVKEVCHQLKAWQAKNLTVLKVAINISPLQFYQSDFIGEFQNCIKESGIKPSLITVEITENLALRDINTAIFKLKALQTMGISIAIDDFGIGYSSLNYLKRLPISILKIDKSFVQASPTNQADSAIIKAVGTLARSLNLTVIAEGVENEAQANHLRSLDCCDEMQGYLFSKAVPGCEIEKFFSKQ